jgi:hypothetical protein
MEKMTDSHQLSAISCQRLAGWGYAGRPLSSHAGAPQREASWERGGIPISWSLFSRAKETPLSRFPFRSFIFGHLNLFRISIFGFIFYA